MKRWRLLALLILSLVIVINEIQAQNKTLRIGYIMETEPDEDNPLFEAIKQEIELVLRSEYKLPINSDQLAYADWNSDNSRKALQAMLENPSIDVVVGVGPLVSDVMAHFGPFSKPVIASIIIDKELQYVEVSEKETSVKSNFNFVLSPYSATRDLDIFYSIYPYRNIAILMQQSLLEGLDEMELYFQNYFEEKEANYRIIPVVESASEILSQLTPEIDAVYVGPVFSIVNPGEVTALIEGINRLSLPSFALAGSELCELGVMASASLSSNYTRIARRIALNIQKILDGVDTKDIHVAMKYRDALHINMETLRKIDFYPKWDILSQAVLLNEEDQNIEREVSLLSVIQEALSENLELQLEDKNIESGDKEIGIAKSVFLPQFSISNLSRVIDKERAESGFGSNPQYASSLSGNIDMLIFSEEANTNRDIQRSLQEIRIHERSALQMDIVKETTEAYINILRAETLVRIQKENLSLNRKNLDLARIRTEIGYSGPSDLYRWESGIALARKEVVNAEKNLRIAKMQLNQIINRPISEKFRTIEISLADNYIITNDSRLLMYIDAPDVFEKFSDFMVEEGLRNLPEIDQIEAGIDIQKRSVLFQKRNKYLPVVAVQAGVDEIYYRGGAGKSAGDLGIPGIGGDPNNLTWSVGLNASLPIYTGNKRKVQYQKARVELERSLIEKNHFLRQFEQRIRIELQETSASYVNIELSFSARDASRKNLSLVQDAYSQGLVPVIQLIDAQNATIQSEEGAANAIFEFVLALIQLERSIGNFYSLATEDQRNNYFERLNLFIHSKD